MGCHEPRFGLITLGGVVLAACSTNAPSPHLPRSSEIQPVRQRWDGIREILPKDQRHVLVASPLLRVTGGSSELSTETGIAGKDWLTERCLQLSYGVPFLIDTTPEPRPEHVGLRSTWRAEELAQRDLCTEGYGQGWRIPTRDETFAFAESGALPPSRFFVTTPNAALAVMEFSPGHVLPSNPPQIVPDRISLLLRAREAGVVCVNPEASATPPLDPTATEIRACVPRVASLIPLDAKTSSVLPRSDIELVVAFAQGCPPNDPKRWSELVARLTAHARPRSEPGRPALSWRDVDQLADEYARALSAVDKGTSLSCEDLARDYRADCQEGFDAPIARCLRLQVSYHDTCGDPSARDALQRTRDTLVDRLVELREHASQVRIAPTLAAKTRQCLEASALANPVKLRLLQTLASVGLAPDPQATRGPSQARAPLVWSCACPLRDLACSFESTLRPEGCAAGARELSAPTPDTGAQRNLEPTPSGSGKPSCGCAAGDLECQMRCPSR